ncbi:MAG: Gfo/Idh/MocA family oxidoreductase [Spirochaetales bacterium]|jgi:predicted dehydrogenase|nr:Gfo/Idh/MocA family oxidoreductase [Spirochaetales bacterium]
MKAALLGCGFIAAVHAQVLNEQGIGVELCLGRRRETLEPFARRWKARRFSLNEEDLLGEDIDVIHICTPPASHYGLVKKCLEGGKHVICEKPLCLDNREARELAALAAEKGLVNGVNFNVRFHRAAGLMRGRVQSSDFGRVLLVHGSYLQEFNVFPTAYDWRYRPEEAGPMRAVTEIGSHWFDFAQFITGRRIVGLQADFGVFFPQGFLKGGTLNGPAAGGEKVAISSEDAAVINMRFDNGALGSLVLSEVSPGRINRLSLEVTGEGASLWWNSEDNNLIHTGLKGEGIRTQVLGFGSGFVDTLRGFFEAVYGDIARAAGGGEGQAAGYADFAQAAQITALCNACRESVLNGGGWVGGLEKSLSF